MDLPIKDDRGKKGGLNPLASGFNPHASSFVPGGARPPPVRAASAAAERTPPRGRARCVARSLGSRRRARRLGSLQAASLL